MIDTLLSDDTNFVAEKNVPALQIIEFDSNDLQANALGLLSESQKTHLYSLWYKQNINPIYVMLIVFPIASAFGKFVVQIHFLIAIVTTILLLAVIKRLFKSLLLYVTKDIKIESFAGTAHSYTDETGWYLQFDDVMTFEIKDQPNKLFRDGKKYRVFMTQKDNIILSAREVDE